MNDCSKSDRPNIVLIYVDDLGYTDLGCCGSGFYESPNIDSLMSNDLRFTEAYSNAPLCSPSRIGLMTGRHCARAGCYEVVDGGWDETAYFRRTGTDPDTLNLDWEDEVDFKAAPNTLNLPEGRKIMPEYLKELGYSTGFFGKWHLGDQRPVDRGFDEFVDLNNYTKKGAHLDVRISCTDKSPRSPEPEGNVADYLAHCSLDFIDKVEKMPFFLYLAHPLVHLPLEAEPELIEKYRAKKGTLLHKNPTYAAMVEMLDNSVGQVVDGLRERDLLENTIIIFASDNGGMTGPTVRCDELDGYELGSITSNYPLRGGKCQLWEGGIRVPMSFTFGDKIARRIYDKPVSQLDILPTLLDLVEHPDFEDIQDDFDGKTLRAILTNPRASMPERSMFWHHPGYRGMTFKPAFEGQRCGYNQRPMTVIRNGDWVLLESLETGATQLYNLNDDIGETSDLALEYPDLVDSLLDELRQWRAEVNAPMPIPKNPS